MRPSLEINSSGSSYIQVEKLKRVLDTQESLENDRNLIANRDSLQKLCWSEIWSIFYQYNRSLGNCHARGEHWVFITSAMQYCAFKFSDNLEGLHQTFIFWCFWMQGSKIGCWIVRACFSYWYFQFPLKKFRFSKLQVELELNYKWEYLFGLLDSDLELDLNYKTSDSD